MSISSALRQQVIEDADYRCAYCKAPSLITGARLIMDHISHYPWVEVVTVKI